MSLIVTTLTLLFRKRRIAKRFAIITLIFGAIYGVVGYSVASSIYSSLDIFQTVEVQSMMNNYLGDVIRSVIGALIWVPYFLASKRVKETLTDKSSRVKKQVKKLLSAG